MGSGRLHLSPKSARLRTGTRSVDVTANRKHRPGNRELLSQLGPAMAMPVPLQEQMEQTLQADFSKVRLYESPVVARHGAEAAASGNQVAFAPGRLNLASSEGVALLGHELSHVRSQSHGETAGGGFLHNPALEHRADADGVRAMQAFDSLSGQTLTPLSASPAPLSLEGPVQAKKPPKKPPSAGDRMKQGYSTLSTAERVTAMRNMAANSMYLQKMNFSEMGEDGRMHNRNELEMENPELYEQLQSENDAYLDLVDTVDEEFMEEMFRQQVEAARDVDTRREISVGNGMGAVGEAQSDFMAKYSPEGMFLDAYRQLLFDLGLYGNGRTTALVENYIEHIGEVQQSDSGIKALLERTQGAVQGKDEENAWVQSEGVSPYAVDALRSNYNNMEANFVATWERPKKRNFFQRLFGRKNRGPSWAPWSRG